MVGFKVGCIWYEIGAASFLHSFFSTVAYNLECGNWGTRFPVIMNELYQGKLANADVPNAKAELNTIESELKKLSPDKVIWDIEDLTKQPPWGKKISNQITDLSNYFITSDGRDFLTVVKAKLFCPEIAGLFCRIAGLFCHDSRANLSLKPVCFGIAIS